MIYTSASKQLDNEGKSDKTKLNCKKSIHTNKYRLIYEV